MRQLCGQLVIVIAAVGCIITGAKTAGAIPQDSGLTGSISGHVSLPGGKPAPGFRVDAHFTRHQSGKPGEGFGVTDTRGNYVIKGLSNEPFYVRVYNTGTGYLPVKPQEVALKGEANGINFTLVSGPQVTVRVHDAESGAAVVGLNVTASDNTVPVEQGKTNKLGEYSFRSSTLDGSIDLKTQEGQRPEIGAAPGYSFHYILRQKTPQDIVWDVRTYKSPVQPEPRVFRGVVLGADGKPLRGVSVQLMRNEAAETTTDRDGKFEFKTYRMSAFDEERHAVVIRANKGELSSVHTVLARETWGQIVVKLAVVRSPVISGTVTAPHGTPIPGVPISYTELLPNASAPAAMSRKFGCVTDAKGNFRITGLTPDAMYQLQAGGPADFGRGEPNFGKTLFPAGNNYGSWLKPAAGQEEKVGNIVVLPADGVVTGKLVSRSGKPVTRKVMIVLEGPHYTYPLTPDPKDGSFRFERVVNEKLTLRVFYGSNDGASFRTGSDSPDLAVKREVHSGDKNLTITIPEGHAKP